MKNYSRESILKALAIWQEDDLYDHQDLRTAFLRLVNHSQTGDLLEVFAAEIETYGYPEKEEGTR